MNCKSIILILILAAWGCKESAPLPHDKLVAVYSDVMLLEGGNQAQYNYGNIPAQVWQRDYDLIFKKHGIDSADFRKSMQYFEKNPEAFSKVLEDVIAALQKAEIEKKIPRP